MSKERTGQGKRKTFTSTLSPVALKMTNCTEATALGPLEVLRKEILRQSFTSALVFA